MPDKFSVVNYPDLRFKEGIGGRVQAYVVEASGDEIPVAVFIKGQTVLDLYPETNFLTYNDLVAIQAEMEKYYVAN